MLYVILEFNILDILFVQLPLSLLGGKRNVDNEVLVFQSRHLMEEVARRLHLDMSYQVKNGLRNDELYTHAPVTVSFPEAEERQVIKVVVTPVDSATVRLSGFSLAVGGGGVRSEEVLDARVSGGKAERGKGEAERG